MWKGHPNNNYGFCEELNDNLIFCGDISAISKLNWDINTFYLFKNAQRETVEISYHATTNWQFQSTLHRYIHNGLGESFFPPDTSPCINCKVGFMVLKFC